MKTIRPSDMEVLARLRGEFTTLRREWGEWSRTAMLRFDELGRRLERIADRLDSIEERLDRKRAVGREEHGPPGSPAAGGTDG